MNTIRIQKLLSFFKWKILYIFSKKNIRIGKGPLNINSSVSCNSKGIIMIGDYFHSDKNLKLRADNGIINIGRAVYMNQNVSVTARDSISIGDNVVIGNNVVIVDHDHKMPLTRNDEYLCEPVKIGNYTWIGANSVILKGTIIGNNCIVGAGAVVKGQFEDYSIILGVPGKNLGRVNED